MRRYLRLVAWMLTTFLGTFGAIWVLAMLATYHPVALAFMLVAIVGTYVLGMQAEKYDWERWDEYRQALSGF